MIELLEIMNIRRSRDKTIGKRRLLEYLAKKHTETYIQIGHEQGFGLKGIMSEVEAAAMWRDARLLDYQAITILKHLRYFFDSKITVPFQKIIRWWKDIPCQR